MKGRRVGAEVDNSIFHWLFLMSNYEWVHCASPDCNDSTMWPLSWTEKFPELLTQSGAQILPGECEHLQKWIHPLSPHAGKQGWKTFQQKTPEHLRSCHPSLPDVRGDSKDIRLLKAFMVSMVVMGSSYGLWGCSQGESAVKCAKKCLKRHVQLW